MIKIKKIGYCETSGCEYADKQTPIELEKGDPVCPGCGSELDGEKSIPWRMIVGLGVLLLVVLGGLGLANHFNLFRIFDREPEYVKDVPIPTPTPVKTPNPLNDCASLPQNKDVWSHIPKRGFITMGVQKDADPMNYTQRYEDSDELWKKAEEKGEDGELERRRTEINWKRTGFDFDLMKLLAAKMGLSGKQIVKAREVKEFKELFCFLNRQEPNKDFSVDVIMSGIAKDDNYNDTISWSDSYLDLYYSLVTKKSSPIKDLADLKGKKIGIVKSDNVVKRFIKAQNIGAEVVGLDDGSETWMTDALNTGIVDAVLQDYPFAVTETQAANEELSDNDPNRLEIRKNNLSSNDPQFNPQYAIGVPAGDPDLLKRINDAIRSVKDTPDYIDLVREYLKSEDIAAPKITGDAYMIKKGDTLSKIALAELNDASRWQELKTLNNIPNIHLIFEGKLLKMPDDWKKKDKFSSNKPSANTKISANKGSAK
jgi:ABC-type amino acid transport substrate-binding protein